MKDNKKDIYSSQAYTIVVSLVAYILSICAIAHIYPREETSFDYLGLIIGVLSLLVTVLIGWQIYTTLDSKRIIKEFKSEIDETKHLHACLQRLVAALSYRPENYGIERSLKKFYIGMLKYLLAVTSYKDRNADDILRIIRVLCNILDKVPSEDKEFTKEEDRECTFLYNQILQQESELTSMEKEQLQDLHKRRTELKPNTKIEATE